MLSEFVSRRNNFTECEYWLRDVNGDPNELIYQSRRPNGTFDAKQMSSETSGVQVIGGVFMIDIYGVSIQTDDDVSFLKANDVVEFKGTFYRITDIQKAIIRNNNQFSDDISYRYYMNLRG